MRSIAGGQSHEAGPIKVHTIKMDQIRILVRVPTRGAKPDLTLLFIDALDSADDEVALGDLTLDRPFLGIDQIQMPPAITLRDIDEFVTPFEPVHRPQSDAFGVRSPDE